MFFYRFYMSTQSEQPSEAILVLPWNRFNNYLICVVALVNLITGAFTLRAALGFAKDVNSFNDALAAATIALFGVMLVWVAWCFRKGVLPVRFVADAARRECGFRWWRFWNGRFDLAAAEKLVGELRPQRGRWHWAVLLPAGSDAEQESSRWIYGSSKSLESEQEARQECETRLKRLAAHLSLPFEIRSAE
ncbi:MAG: hypothetical protein ACI8XO_002633 [Verrucomicrobiales bacterium]|jgi:hypothetical protein